jgi:hypothetical protein
MLRIVCGMTCGAALILAFVSANASAQNRPAAWDTRVVRSPAPLSAQDDKNAKEQREQNEKTKKTLDAAGDQKTRKAKAN